METKKHKSASLEQNRITFILVGLAMTLALVYTAMEWSSAQSNVLVYNSTTEVVDDEYIAINTTHKPPPPPPPPKKAIADIIEILDNDAEDPDEIMVVEEYNEEESIAIIEEEEEEETYTSPFVVVEYMPEYPGGNAALMRFISKNLKYPVAAREMGLQGRVYVRFVISAKGKVSQVSVIRGVDPLLDEEAVKVVKKLTGWKAGRQRNKAVPVWFTLPIMFKLK